MKLKRRKLIFSCFCTISAVTLSTLLLIQTTETAIVPPPWSDPEKNPCAALPGGWQLLYWPPLMKCFKIFTIGHPCPETMELSPIAFNGNTRNDGNNNTATAECRCPPGTALSIKTNRCHTIFERGPCARGQFFRPVPIEQNYQQLNKRIGSLRWGNCATPHTCPQNMLFWPKDGKCYTKFTKGPCSKGKLLVQNSDQLAECACHNAKELSAYFYNEEETCHEHYTKGPCSTPGHLFLPGGRCGCHKNLPHFHEEQQMCYELNTPGPCPSGHIFNIPENVTTSDNQLLWRAHCRCKDGYVPWPNGNCYRLYTRGPCGPNEFLINSTSCLKNTCGKNRLYFPDQKSCYRIGSQGPCSLHQVVVFDFTTRPSVDGISYNGMCGCSGILTNLNQQCTDAGSDSIVNTCESTPGMVELNGICYKLYSRGPCGPGQWLVPRKASTNQKQPMAHMAKCACRPGYTTSANDGNEGEEGENMMKGCNAPSVEIARYLNNQRQNHKFTQFPSEHNFHYPPFQIFNKLNK